MTLTARARLGAAATVGLLASGIDVAIHRSRLALGKQAFLDMETHFFDRWYGTLHPGWSLVYGFCMAALWIWVYELVSRGLVAIMRSSAGTAGGRAIDA